jgi:hypothetical protein
VVTHGAACLLVVILVACQSRDRVDPFDAPEPELATEEVAALPTDGLSPDADVQGARPRNPADQLVGRLPSTFPSDLPVFRPASVTNFSNPNDVPRSIELTIARPPGDVAAYYSKELTARGWQAVDARRWQKDGRRIDVEIKGVGGGDTVAKILY